LQNVPAEIPGGIGFGNCRFQALGRQGVFAAQKNVGNIGLNGIAGNDDALDQLMGVPFS
jgi:hypothetical protein